MHDGKLFAVKHRPDDNFVALPGGRLEFGENPKDGLVRELYEEFLITAEIGELVYVNNFVTDTTHSVEFIFRVVNAQDFINADTVHSSHGFEIFQTLWLDTNTNETLLPSTILTDFREGSIPHGNFKFI